MELRNRFNMPKLSVDSKLKERANQTAEVVAEDLGQNLVDLRRGRLGANPRAKLSLNHRKGRFHIRPLVVVLQEFFAVLGEEVVEITPPSAALWGPSVDAAADAVRLERDKRERADATNGVDILMAEISLVGRDLFDRKPLCGRLEEGR